MTTTPEDSTSQAFIKTLELVRGGDDHALNALFEQFYPSVERLVHQSLSADLRRSRPWLAARLSTGDIVQEVFRSVLADVSGFGGNTEQAFSGYLAMVVRNRLIDTIRFHEAERRDGRRSHEPLFEDDHEAKDRSPDSEAVSSEELDRFYDAIRAFPEREQLLLRARVEGTASFTELSEQLGYSSVSAARRAFFATQAKLAVQLRPVETEEEEEA